MILRWNMILAVGCLSLGALAQGFEMPRTGLVSDADGGHVDMYVAGSGATSEQEREVILHQNTPNPFTRATMIQFNLPRSGHARLTVHDLIGQEVARLVDGDLPAGSHRVTLDGRDLPDGVYFYRLTYEGNSRTKICLLLK